MDAPEVLSRNVSAVTNGNPAENVDDDLIAVAAIHFSSAALHEALREERERIGASSADVRTSLWEVNLRSELSCRVSRRD